MDTVLTPEMVVSGQNKLAFPRGHGDFLYWMERLADEKGRWVVRRRNIATQNGYETLTPDGYAVASKVHEYGGIAYGIGCEGLVWINRSDQAVYLSHGGHHRKLYQHPDWRFGEPLVCPQGVILIAEHKQPQGFPVNMLVLIDWNDRMRVIHSGADFYAAPALSPRGNRLLWITWDLPAMPWQQSWLWVADFQADGTITHPTRLVHEPNVAVFQPDFTPEGTITYIQDRSGFGRLTLGEQQTTVGEENCEYGLPLWQLGMRTYANLGKDCFLTARAEKGVWSLVRHDGDQECVFCLDDAHISDPVKVGKGFATLVAPQDGAQQIGYWPDANREHSIILHKAADCHEAAWVRTPESLWFEGSCGAVQGYFYCPDIHKDTLPPVIIKCHGGPSGQTDPALNLKHQFWLSRGFAIFDINYSGSTGFGRAYLERLNGRWGELDIADCIAGLEFLIDSKRIDPRKAFISGSSAGGLTVLGCLCNSALFAGGVCAYGVADLERLVAITHKFEAQYLDSLVGRLPEAKAIYHARSPLYQAGKIRAPMLFLQGLQDFVVPAEQTKAMVEAITSQPDAPEVTALYFDHEGHGFSDPDNSLLALKTEAEFYDEILTKIERK